MSAEQTIALPKSAVELAAWICECYAEFIRDDVLSKDIDRHPYVPQIEGCAEDLREAIAAQAATPAPGAPAGFKLVPIRPTIGQLKAGGTAVLSTYCSRASARPDRDNLSTADVAYRAMLDAAPGAPGQEAAVAWQMRTFNPGHGWEPWMFIDKEGFDIPRDHWVNSPKAPEFRALGVIAALPPSGAGEKTS